MSHVRFEGLRKGLLRKLLLFMTALPVAVATADDGPPPPDFMVADGDTLWLTDPIVILGSRIPVAMPGLVRNVSVMDADDLERLPVRSVAEALALMPEVEVSQRRQCGAQADLSIRGSTYQQVRVLLDGFPVGDPQTAHHSLDLPVGRQDIARLEVLGGHGATLYGTGAFGGTVNLATREPSRDRGGELEVGAGDFASRSGHLSLESGTGRLGGARMRTRAGLEIFSTDGDRPGADAEILTLSGRSRLSGRVGDLDILAGYARREFGALDFYAPYPSFERTATFFAALRSRHDLGKRIVLEPRLHVRRHTDHFVLIRETPNVYANDHVNRGIGAETRLSLDTGGGLSLAAGLEAGYEDIESTGVRGGVSGPALGDHLRRRAAAGLELSGAHDRWNWTAGARLNRRTGLDARLSRSAAAAWRPFDSLTLRGSTGTVYRAPSFTELHYVDPLNRGDSALKPEHGWAWDGGFDWRRGAGSLGVTFFERRETDLIDWTRPDGDGDAVWQAANIGRAKVRGWTGDLMIRGARGHTLHLGYTYLDKEIGLPAGRVSKYALTAFRHLLSARLDWPLGRRLRLLPSLRYRDPLLGASHLVGDVSLRADWPRFFSRLTITNLGDRAYAEVPGVPMPGRMISVSAGRRF